MHQYKHFVKLFLIPNTVLTHTILFSYFIFDIDSIVLTPPLREEGGGGGGWSSTALTLLGAGSQQVDDVLVSTDHLHHLHLRGQVTQVPLRPVH